VLNLTFGEGGFVSLEMVFLLLPRDDVAVS
jgi:hypothetical protein